MSENKLTSYVKKPIYGAKPKQIVIFLHGLGANGQDLLGIGDEWAHDLPDCVFVSPDAPFACDMAPVGFQWFSFLERTEMAIKSGVEEALPILNKFIDEQLELYGLDDSKLALVGFSQGAMMSLYAAPRREKPCAGIVGYSGALIGEEDLVNDNIVKMPICLMHGDVDPVVPVDEYHKAKIVLENVGFEVSGEVYSGLAHGINGEGIIAGGKFLKQAFSML